MNNNFKATINYTGIINNQKLISKKRNQAYNIKNICVMLQHIPCYNTASIQLELRKFIFLFSILANAAST